MLQPMLQPILLHVQRLYLGCCVPACSSVAVLVLPGDRQLWCSTAFQLMVSANSANLSCFERCILTMCTACLPAVVQVERLTTYSDGECLEPLCMLEVFERRQDKLTKRLVQPAQRSSTVSFAPGAAFCLRSVATIRPPAGQQGGELELEFYTESRADGLVKRTCSSSGMQEWFQPGCRSDTLLHRSVEYSAVQAAAAPTAFQTAIRKTSDAAAIAAAAGAASRAASLEAHGHRSSVSAAWDANERTLASIREQYCPPAATAEAAPGTVLVRRFELAASQLQVVVLGPGGVGTDDEAGGTVTRTYGELKDPL